jgi:hypothetical protein
MPSKDDLKNEMKRTSIAGPIRQIDSSTAAGNAAGGSQRETGLSCIHFHPDRSLVAGARVQGRQRAASAIM